MLCYSASLGPAGGRRLTVLSSRLTVGNLRPSAESADCFCLFAFFFVFFVSWCEDTWGFAIYAPDQGPG